MNDVKQKELVDRVVESKTIGEAIEVLTSHNMSIGNRLWRLLLENNVIQRRDVLRQAAETPSLAEALLSQGE